MVFGGIKCVFIKLVGKWRLEYELKCMEDYDFLVRNEILEVFILVLKFEN